MSNLKGTIVDWWDSFSSWFSNKIEPIHWRRVWYGLVNLRRWLPLVWKDRDWDHYFLHKVMHFKLSNMERSFRENDNHTRALQDADKIRLCVMLLNRIMADDYHNLAGGRHHDLKWGHLEMIPTGDYTMVISRKNVITKEDEIIERKEIDRINKREDILKKADLEYLYSTLHKYVLYWWD